MSEASALLGFPASVSRYSQIPTQVPTPLKNPPCAVTRSLVRVCWLWAATLMCELHSLRALMNGSWELESGVLGFGVMGLVSLFAIGYSSWYYRGPVPISISLPLPIPTPMHTHTHTHTYSHTHTYPYTYLFNNATYFPLLIALQFTSSACSICAHRKSGVGCLLVRRRPWMRVTEEIFLSSLFGVWELSRASGYLLLIPS